jgi:methylated-DNA-protein-cysteine methyltransferase-like protein
MSSSRKRAPKTLSFEEKVARAVKAIPFGQVSSYGQIALRAGFPGRARHVAKVLNSIPDLPWWRVIQSKGTLAPHLATRQKRRLLDEGIVFKRGRIVG